jgi:hypothetical protein
VKLGGVLRLGLDDTVAKPIARSIYVQARWRFPGTMAYRNVIECSITN